MKIDIHTHTKKCKKGDAPTREISAVDFCEKILATEVRIIAITNHNVFDLDQYEEIKSRLGEDAQVWPGVELDVLYGEQRGHLLVIVSPKLANAFFEVVEELTRGSNPDRFNTTVDKVLEVFDDLDPLYVAHYKQKKPSLPDEALDVLVTKTKNPEHVIKEVTNSISAGIYISHGHSSIYGSDIQDWAMYEDIARELPDLRLPVDSFEHFCLLLKKDPTTINTALNRKTSEELVLAPFDDSSLLTLRVFDDINVIFGSKGTGKSCILNAIARYYSESGLDANVYESASDRLGEIFDTKGKDLQVNLNSYDLNYCSDEIEAVRSAREVAVTALSKYVTYFKIRNTNRNAKRILLKDIEPEGEGSAKHDFLEFNEAAKRTADFLSFLKETESVKKELNREEFGEVTRILSGLLERLRRREWTNFLGWKEVHLLNFAITVFRREVERKTGAPAKPTTTGFRDYAINRVNIELTTGEIVRNIDSEIPIQIEPVGSLGSSKGDLEFCTEFIFQNGAITDGTLSSLSGVKKTTQKNFANAIRKVYAHVYEDDLFQYISALNEIEDVEEIDTVYELLLFKRYFSLDDQPYSPSSGEASMVMLQKELEEDKDIYILDEPERSLGNEYINDVIVPLVKERARAGKKVFISTHDANIAVRTLPYSSVYRCHGKFGYRTYIGNPFTNYLINTRDESDRIDWKKISMRILEGGETAFGERGTIYGNY